jgi:DNA repair protein RadA
MELAEMKGLKARQIKILQDAGVDSIEALAMSVPGDLQDLEGISDKSAKKLVWDARDLLHLTEFVPVSAMKEDYYYITTGSANLDKILGGGISSKRITEVFGAFKSGKTNLSHTLCVTTQMPMEQGGLDGAVLYIDTENTFSKVKIGRIASRFGLDPAQVLGRIFHAKIFSCDHQMQMVRQAEAAIKTYGAKLIIVDSLMAMFRSEYVGIGMLAARQQMLNKLIHDLSRLAETYNIAILVTNQVTTVMKGTFVGTEAIGGNIVAHGCHIRMQFKTSGFAANASLERTATIVDAPDLAPESATFFITAAGIADTEAVDFETPAETSSPTTSSSLFQAAVGPSEPENGGEDGEEPENEKSKGKSKAKTTVKSSAKGKSNAIKGKDPLIALEELLS